MNKGSSAGIDEATFAPNEKITREQMAIMLDKFTDSTGLVLPETECRACTFTDSALISSWASGLGEQDRILRPYGGVSGGRL
ncbi:MAG: S-layer homology domain-containing protein [Syntrophomonadaceae bacterium]